MSNQVASKQHWPTVSRRLERSEILYASYVTAWALVILLGSNDRLWHWFVIPTFICGLLVGTDAARWVKGDYDLFDPKGIVGGFGWHFFFLAPLLFIHLDVGMRYVIPPRDWRPWVGYLSILNILALLLYHAFHKWGFNWRVSYKETSWFIKRERAIPWFLIFGGVALIAQLYFFHRSEGIEGILDAAASRRGSGMSRATGLGLFEIAGNSLPILVLIFFTLFKNKVCLRRSSMIWAGILLLVLLIVQFVAGGFKGSRSATIWSLFWMAGIIHYFWRPISRRLALVALVILVGFMYLYGFYKGSSRLGGVEAIELLFDGTSLSELETTTGRSFRTMLVGDMARIDTQSYQLYRFVNPGDYDLRWGSTYYNSLLSFIPSWIWKDRPRDPEKVQAGTELLLGRGSYVPGDRFRNSQRVYGLGGEAMLNFGVLSFPLPFILWGFLIGRYRRVSSTWSQGDARWFLAPFITLLFLIALIGDLYNLLGFFISKGLFPLLLFSLVYERRN